MCSGWSRPMILGRKWFWHMVQPHAPNRTPSPAPPGSTVVRQVLGAIAVTALVALFAWPVLRRSDAAMPTRAPTAAALDERAEAAAASGPAVQELLGASEKLKEAAAKALAAGTSTRKSALPAAPVDDVTACIETFVPKGTFGPGLDWVCRQPDVWSIQLDLHARALKRGSGPGAELWVRLGRFELGAIAVLRTACCGNAAPLQAKVPVTKCGSLTDALIALGSDPSPEQTQRYDQSMTCLAERKVWFPEAWSRIKDEQAKRTFDEFLAFVRKR